MQFKQRAIEIYDKKYKKLLILPIAMLVLALIQIAVQTATTGDFVNKGISLKGGSTITIITPADSAELEQFLRSKFPGLDITVRDITDTGEVIGIAIESIAQADTEIAAVLAATREKVTVDDYAIEVTGDALGRSFFRQTFTALIMAFFLMAVVVFAYFRIFIPSVAVVLAAFSDIVVTLAIFNLTGMKLSTAGIAAFLMLIGYSVDTDILLTSRVLKRHEGTVLERIFSALKTGMTMTITTIVAALVAIILTNSPVVRQIMLIILIGMAVDIINTWIQNAAILRLYVEKRNAGLN
ncbi:protein translocase subunit SecF [Candidatus Woesearchaeota archaeon]|nr:protein translocase subunit SecF [Candidatus Woesearchaeota archaeon]